MRLIVVLGGKTIQIEAIEKETPTALIGLALSGFYTLGGLIETHTGYGVQVSGELTFLWRGSTRTITGAVVPLISGPDLVLPFGTLGD